MTTQSMPAVFFGHGRPSITLEHNSTTEAWRAFSARIPRPQAIVVISAHWFINATAVTAMSRPRTVHDFFGGSDELYAFRYPAPGHPDLAARMVDLVKPTWLGLDVDSWGLDHGSWSLLAHLYPEADIPVLQLSVKASLPFRYHVDFGAQLAPLRDEGILIIGSGNIVHNGAIRSEEGRARGDLERARRFSAAVVETMTTDPNAAHLLEDHPDYRVAAPTDDHFLPVLYLAGLAAAAGEPAALLNDRPDGESLGATSFSIGMSSVADPDGRSAALSEVG